MHYLLTYEFVPDYAARRAEFREEHLRLGWTAHERGELVLAGALAPPMDTGVLLFRGPTPAAAEDFARNDPYVRHGLVLRWQVRQWVTVIGAMAETPVHP